MAHQPSQGIMMGHLLEKWIKTRQVRNVQVPSQVIMVKQVFASWPKVKENEIIDDAIFLLPTYEQLQRLL